MRLSTFTYVLRAIFIDDNIHSMLIPLTAVIPWIYYTAINKQLRALDIPKQEPLQTLPLLLRHLDTTNSKMAYAGDDFSAAEKSLYPLFRM